MKIPASSTAKDHAKTKTLVGRRKEGTTANDSKGVNEVLAAGIQDVITPTIVTSVASVLQAAGRQVGDQYFGSQHGGLGHVKSMAIGHEEEVLPAMSHEEQVLLQSISITPPVAHHQFLYACWTVALLISLVAVGSLVWWGEVNECDLGKK